MRTWYTADTHFCHTNILHHVSQKRKWKHVRDMDEYLIKAWNSTVGPEDKVYHLGDFCLGPKHRKKEILTQLNGYKIAIRGNHDAGPQHMLEIGFHEVYTWLVMSLMRPDKADRTILLIHEANGFVRNSTNRNVFDYILCGHVHDNWKRRKNAVNVGVDQWDFKPIELPIALAVFNVDMDCEWTVRTIAKPKYSGKQAVQELYTRDFEDNI